MVTLRQGRLDRLRSIRSSKECAGTVAECEQAELLRGQLPDSFHLFHDLTVETRDWFGTGEITAAPRKSIM